MKTENIFSIDWAKINKLNSSAVKVLFFIITVDLKRSPHIEFGSSVIARETGLKLISCQRSLKNLEKAKLLPSYRDREWYRIGRQEIEFMRSAVGFKDK